MRTVMPREFYIPKGATKVADKSSDAVAYVYQTGDRLYALAFLPKASKPSWHFRFRTPAEREKHIADFFAGQRKHLELVAETKAKRNRPHKLEVGHILKSSWGYDQTNVDFYQITKLIGTHTVEIRKIGQTVDETGWAQGTCTPVLDKFIGEPMRKRVTYGDSVRIASYASAHVWSGTPARWSSYA